jgi:hypothetical protein
MSDSDIDLAIKTSRRLEGLLETRYGAEGRGLHEKLAAVEAMLSPEALRNGRYVATMRNKVVHEDGFSLPDRPRFINSAAAFEKEVGGGRTVTAAVQFPWGVLICAGGLVLLVAGPRLIPKRYGLEGFTTFVMSAFLVMAIPPMLWLRERPKGWLPMLWMRGRPKGRPQPLWLTLLWLGLGAWLFVVPYYILSELGRYVVGRLRGAA